MPFGTEGLANFTGLALLRGSACPWGRAIAAEGLMVAVAAWSATDGIAGRFSRTKNPQALVRWAGGWGGSRWP